MDITQETFEARFQDTVDVLLATMAEQGEIPPEKFYTVACILENLTYFSPVIYGLLKESDLDSV